jgi:tagatose 1,6-diphosphate aldolase GatY/KbaY
MWYIFATEASMGLVPMADLLKRGREHGYAVPAFCVWNLETAETVLRAAASAKSPVILLNGPGEFPLVRPADLSLVVSALSKRYPVPAALHLDHGRSLSQVQECLAAGYTSVMLDCSSEPFSENVKQLQQAVALARPCGATVEGEIGQIGASHNAPNAGIPPSALTDPDEAAAYAEQTGVGALAISIGNAHGHYTKLPNLDFARLAAIRERVSVPLVLHGGSDTPEADLRRAISLGIAKVNVATELVTAARESLLGQWKAGENVWIPAALAQAMRAIGAVVERWIRLTGAAGQS